MSSRIEYKSVQELRQALESIAPLIEGQVLRPTGTYLRTRIAAYVTTKYMRDGSSDPGSFTPISFSRRGRARRAGATVYGPRPTASGPLRILSGRLVRSITGARTGTGASEAIDEMELKNDVLIVRKGSKVPYARIHEFGGMAGRGLKTRIPARPYLHPAVTAALPEGQSYGARKLNELFKNYLKGPILPPASL